MNKSQSKYFNTAAKFDEALLTLLERKSFEYVTVSELCKEAGVNRSTFYLHYENTCDVLKEASRYVLARFASYFPEHSGSGSSDLDSCRLQDLNFITEEYLLPYLSFMKENHRVFQAVMSQPDTFRTDTIFKSLYDNIFDPILDRFDYPKPARKYTMLFYLNGITAIITEWLKDGCRESTEEISTVIRDCIFGRERPPALLHI